MRCDLALRTFTRRVVDMTGRFGASFKTSVEYENEEALLGADNLFRHARLVMCTRRSLIALLLSYLALYMLFSYAFCDNDGVCLAPGLVYPSADELEMLCTTINITLQNMTHEGVFHYAGAPNPIKLNVSIWRLKRITECAFKKQDDPDDDKKRRFTYEADYVNDTGIGVETLWAAMLVQYPLNSPAYTVWYYAMRGDWCSPYMRDQTDVNCLSSKPIDTSDFSISSVGLFFSWLFVCFFAAFMLAGLWLVGFLFYRIHLHGGFSGLGAYRHHELRRVTVHKNSADPDSDDFS